MISRPSRGALRRYERTLTGTRRRDGSGPAPSIRAGPRESWQWPIFRTQLPGEYRQRCGVSLPCAGWERVVPPRSNHQGAQYPTTAAERASRPGSCDPRRAGLDPLARLPHPLRRVVRQLPAGLELLRAVEPPGRTMPSFIASRPAIKAQTLPRGGCWWAGNSGNTKAEQCSAFDHALGSGRGIRTPDLRVMSPTSYHCSIPRRSAQSSTRGERARAAHSPRKTARAERRSSRYRMRGCASGSRTCLRRGQALDH